MTPKPTEAAELLRRAAALVDDAMLLVNSTATQCHVCRRPIAEDHDQSRVYLQFTDLPTKLREAANRLDNAVLRGPSKEHGYELAKEFNAARDMRQRRQ